MHVNASRGSSAEGAQGMARRIALALIAMVIGGAFAIDTWTRGWSWPVLAAMLPAAIGACCAAIGRVTKRPALERFVRPLAFGSIIVASIILLFRAAGRALAP
jgi:hypothetical protein